ncbi:MAG: endonuclease MutS2, partial [Ruminococcus sp.]|nr:endonuclease MutS2 [Ruminococcus sp.]
MYRHYRALELDKILNLLAERTSCEESREMALELKPEFNLIKAEHNLKMTDDAYVLTGKFGAPSFGNVKNVANELRRGEAGGMLTAKELLKIAEVLRVIRGVKQWQSKCISTHTTLDILFQGLVVNKFLEDKIHSCIINEEEFADTASPALSDIRRKIRTATSKARETLDKIIHSSTYQKYLQDAIVTQRDGRYVIPVKAECRGNIAGLVHDTSASGQTVFIEPMGVVQANNDIKVLISKEEAEIERIL